MYRYSRSIKLLPLVGGSSDDVAAEECKATKHGESHMEMRHAAVRTRASGCHALRYY